MTTKPARIARVLGWIGGVIVGVPCIAWAAGALYFDLPAPSPVRVATSLAWVLGVIVAVLFIKRKRWAAVIAAVGFCIILGWWLTLRPSQDRPWQPDVAKLAHAIIEGDRVTIENLRNCEYRSELDYDARYETRAYHLENLRGAEYFHCTWGSPWMAHPIVSFDFGPDGRVCFSIETRKEIGESYSAVGGLYRQYELIYIVADERDVVRLRTNFRKGEDAHWYRFRLPVDKVRERFMGYIRRVNELHDKPEWYNALTDNCTTSIRLQQDAAKRAPFDWRMLLNGKMDEMLYERGAIEGRGSFEEVRRAAFISDKARAAGDAPDFSERIRMAP